MSPVRACVWLFLYTCHCQFAIAVFLSYNSNTMHFHTGLTAIIFSINYDSEALNHVTGTHTPPEAAQIMEPVVARGEVTRVPFFIL